MDLLQRDFELSQLDDAVDRARAGSGLMVLVRGEAGIGKSELLRALVERCRSEVHLLVGACDDLLTPSPLEPFWDMAETEPGVRSALESQDASALFGELFDLMNRKIRPTVVVIDDIHWADQATIDVIRRVGRRIDQTHGLLVVAFRDEDTPVEHPLRTVIGDVPPRSMLRIRLGPFDRESIAQLGGQDRADELLHLTGGNPLLVTEMIRSDRDVPTSVSDLVIARLNRLPEVSRSIVELVSMIPGDCDPHLVNACIAYGSVDLETCETSGLLAVSPSRVSFRHELIRRAVERTIRESIRIELNARILAVLEKRGTNIARLVHHAREAGDIDAIVEYTPQAAQKATSAGSRREAAAHYRTLEAHLDHYQPAVRAQILEAWSVAEFDLGDIGKARELRVAAVDIYREEENRLALARCLVPLPTLDGRMKRPDEALRHAAEAVAILEDENAPAPDLAYAYAERAHTQSGNLDLPAAKESISRAIEIAEEVDDPEILAIVAARELWTLESWDDISERGNRALRLAAEAGSASVARYVYVLLTQRAVEIHPSDRGDIIFRAMELAEAHELDGFRAFVLLSSSEIHLQAGRFTACEDEARLAAALNPDYEHNLTIWPLALIARSQLRRGTPRARDTIGEIVDLDRPIMPNSWGGWDVLAEAHWLNPNSPFDPDAAMAEHKFRVAHPHDWVFHDSALAFWLWKLGLLTEFPELLHSQYRRQIEGDWKGAAKEWADWERPYEQSLALCDGTLEARLEALSILDGLGAVPLASRIRQELRQQGVNGVPSGPRPTTRDHAAGLTARQSEVVSLMAEGLTNTEIADRLFISSRTAENHVAGILSRLNVHSREDAVVVAETVGFLEHV